MLKRADNPREMSWALPWGMVVILESTTSNIPKVVGGCTAACTEMGCLFYAQALEHVVPVSSTQVAEMVKLLENTFRMINIGLVNEMALMCDRIGINVWEVIDAAGPLHPHRSVLPLLENQAGGHRGALRRWPGTSTARCRTSWWTRCRTR